MTSVNLGKTLKYLKIQENLTYGLKISKSFICVKEYFYMFFSALKDIEAQIKTNR